MEINFGNSPCYSLGVEEEFQILDAETFELVSRIDAILPAFAGEQDEPQVKPELMQSMLEVSTGIAQSVGQAVEDLASLRGRVQGVAAESNACIASAGTHPFSRYQHQDVTERPRYKAIQENLRWLTDRQLVFGLHLHVGLDSADKAIGCANAVRTFLPELLALSANSPFWHGRETGLASTRIPVADGYLRSGLPPVFASFAEFELLIERCRRTASFPDYTYLWWNLRPHPRLGTLEVRVCDAQTRIGSVAALAALVQSLVATFGEAFERGERLPDQPSVLIEENKWRASRDGLGAHLIDLERDTERSAPEAIRALVERCEPAARRLGCARELAEVEAIIERGSGADEQRRLYEREQSLLTVARWLNEETIGGV